MEKLIAVHDKIVLKKLESEDKMVGGIIIPDTGKEKSNYFQVVSVGRGMYNPHMGNYYPKEVLVGDIVIVPKAVVTQILVDGDEYYVCREVEVLTVIREDKEDE
jgi:chaperonin GroES